MNYHSTDGAPSRLLAQFFKRLECIDRPDKQPSRTIGTQPNRTPSAGVKAGSATALCKWQPMLSRQVQLKHFPKIPVGEFAVTS